MIKNKYSTLILSTILSCVLIVLGYFVNNLPIFTGENLDQYFLIQKTSEFLRLSPKYEHTDAFFINVSYDKELVNVNGAGPDGVLGNTSITDRNKLYELLKILKEDSGYKYIVLDIMFDPNEISSADSSLFSLIQSMNNVVIIRDDNIPVPSTTLMDKSALADYFATITATNFVRYQFLDKNESRYIPLKVYEDLYGDVEFEAHGFKFIPFYTSGGKLCYNSCFIAFDSEHFSTYNKVSKDYSSIDYYNLGSDLLNYPFMQQESARKERITTLAKDKYVFVGNFNEDIHDTYMGPRPGSLILYRALKTLEEQKHIVKIWQILYWFIIFAGVFWAIFEDKEFSNLLPRRISEKLANHKLISFIVASLSYVTILFVFSSIEYILVHKIYSIVLPLYAFMLTKFIHDYKQFKS